jgi:serine/threonine protein kinase
MFLDMSRPIEDILECDTTTFDVSTAFESISRIVHLVWPTSDVVHAQKEILKQICVQPSTIVSLVYVKDRLLVMKECLYIEQHARSIISEVYMNAMFTLDRSMIGDAVPSCEYVQLTPHAVYLYFEYIPLEHMTLFPAVSLQRSTRILHSLAQILARLERYGIAHQDIKVTNIGYRSDGRVVLLDFDSAVLRRRTKESNMLVCTVTTRAPEIGVGVYDVFIAQVWSLGILWCEMLACENMFCEAQWDTIQEHARAFSVEMQEGKTRRSRVLKQRLGSMYTVVLGMIIINPVDRMTLSQVLECIK